MARDLRSPGSRPSGHAPSDREASPVDPSRGPADQERPVGWAWEYSCGKGQWETTISDFRPADKKWRRNIRPLYEHPPAPASSGEGWRADCFRARMAEFDAAYKKACGSSQPQDWMDAALLAQQFRNVAYAVLTGEAPKQEPPASVGWVLVPQEPDDAMVQAGGSMLPPTHRLTDCYDYFREAWAAALDARPIPPFAPGTAARSAETSGLGPKGNGPVGESRGAHE